MVKFGLNSGGVLTIDDKGKVDASAVKISDIALGLSKIQRFCGQLDRPYSVAEHCIHLQSLYPPEDTTARLAALHHEDGEALGINDVHYQLKPKDLKKTETAILKSLGFPEFKDHELDRDLGDYEFATMHPARSHSPYTGKIKLKFWNFPPEAARILWLSTYYQIVDTEEFLLAGTLKPFFDRPRKLSDVLHHYNHVETWAIMEKMNQEQLECYA